MKMSIGVEHRVGLPNYSSVSYSAHITVSHTDVGYNDMEILEASEDEVAGVLQEFAEEKLAQMMRPALKKARDLATRDSYVHDVKGY